MIRCKTDCSTSSPRRNKGKKPARIAKPEPETPSNVIDIMDALRKSISSENKSKRG